MRWAAPRGGRSCAAAHRAGHCVPPERRRRAAPRLWRRQSCASYYTPAGRPPAPGPPRRRVRHCASRAPRPPDTSACRGQCRRPVRQERRAERREGTTDEERRERGEEKKTNLARPRDTNLLSAAPATTATTEAHPTHRYCGRMDTLYSTVRNSARPLSRTSRKVPVGPGPRGVDVQCQPRCSGCLQEDSGAPVASRGPGYSPRPRRRWPRRACA